MRGASLAQGPFETWQAAGWAEIARRLPPTSPRKAMSATPLRRVLEAGLTGGMAPMSFGPPQRLRCPLGAAVYQRQLFPERVLGVGATRKIRETLYENDGLALWTLPAVDAGIGIISVNPNAHHRTRCSMADRRRPPG